MMGLFCAAWPETVHVQFSVIELMAAERPANLAANVKPATSMLDVPRCSRCGRSRSSSCSCPWSSAPPAFLAGYTSSFVMMRIFLL